jgi:putative toxin-antitoxin system antitoxin component (TIGR02293 family)
MNLSPELIDLLGGTGALGGHMQSESEWRAAVRGGLPYSTMLALAASLGLELNALAGLVAISERTLQRRKAGALTPEESDRLVRVARVVSHAVGVLGSRERAMAWLKAKNIALGDEAPLTMLDTDIGASEVDSVLNRIEHGVFS